ncbi:MAG: hypothetical protein IPN58_04165 [Anaerolineales bacterium]|nr:hypothetical protein [Anaerolineales bacterium]
MLAQVTPASAYGAPVCASATITVTNNNDSGAGSLRQALVDVCPGETINFSEALAGQIITLISPLVIDRNVTINGQLAAEVVDIEGNAVVRVMTVNNGVTAFLDNLYIYDGSSANGGIIRNDGTLTVTNISVVSGSSSNNGGGIYNAGTLTVTNSTVDSNSAATNAGGIYNTGTLTVTNSTVQNNTTVYGGGISTAAALDVRIAPSRTIASPAPVGAS